MPSKCPACGQKLFKWAQKNDYDIYRCSSCNSLFVFTFNSNLYNRQYFETVDKDRVARRNQFLAHSQWIIYPAIDYGAGVDKWFNSGEVLYWDPFFGEIYIDPLKQWRTIFMLETIEHIPAWELVLLPYFLKGIGCERFIVQSSFYRPQLEVSWWYIDPPNHITFLTLEGLEKLMEPFGTKIFSAHQGGECYFVVFERNG